MSASHSSIATTGPGSIKPDTPSHGTVGNTIKESNEHFEAEGKHVGEVKYAGSPQQKQASHKDNIVILKK